MRSVVDDLKLEQRKRVMALSPGERVRLALRLGTWDLETFRLAQEPPLDRKTAARELRRRRQHGRRPSSCAGESNG